MLILAKLKRSVWRRISVLTARQIKKNIFHRHLMLCVNFAINNKIIIYIERKVKVGSPHPSCCMQLNVRQRWLDSQVLKQCTEQTIYLIPWRISLQKNISKPCYQPVNYEFCWAGWLLDFFVFYCEFSGIRRKESGSTISKLKAEVKTGLYDVRNSYTDHSYSTV